ncbi:MAG: hypothetical protein AVDCRST_MAG68-1077, partial [uncultured Gemmatimonadetes bacterium]
DAEPLEGAVRGPLPGHPHPLHGVPGRAGHLADLHDPAAGGLPGGVADRRGRAGGHAERLHEHRPGGLLHPGHAGQPPHHELADVRVGRAGAERGALVPPPPPAPRDPPRPGREHHLQDGHLPGDAPDRRGADARLRPHGADHLDLRAGLHPRAAAGVRAPLHQRLDGGDGSAVHGAGGGHQRGLLLRAPPLLGADGAAPPPPRGHPERGGVPPVPLDDRLPRAPGDGPADHARDLDRAHGAGGVGGWVDPDPAPGVEPRPQALHGGGTM